MNTFTRENAMKLMETKRLKTHAQVDIEKERHAVLHYIEVDNSDLESD